MELEEPVKQFLSETYANQENILSENPKSILQILDAWTDIARYRLGYGEDILEAAKNDPHMRTRRQFYALSQAIERWARMQNLDVQFKFTELAQTCINYSDPSLRRSNIPRPTEADIARMFNDLMPRYHAVRENALHPQDGGTAQAAPEGWITVTDATAEYLNVMCEYSDGITFGNAKKQISTACTKEQIRCVGTRLKRRIDPLDLNRWINSKRDAAINAADDQ